MALDPKTRYPGQVSTVDPVGYPGGKAQDIAVLNDGTGTPFEKDLVNDIFGLQQALLDAVHAAPTNVPDKVGASQYVDAIIALTERAPLTKVRNWPDRSSFAYGGGGAATDVALGFGPGMGVAGGPLHAAMPDGLDVYTSEDGQLWTSRGNLANASSANSSISFGQISGAPSLLIGGNGSGGFYKTVDGITWVFVAGSVNNPVSVYAPTLPLWVRAGDAGALHTSPDGVTWTARSTPAGWIAGCGGVKRIVWSGAMFVALPRGSYNKCLTSPDGLTWTERTLPATGLWTGLAYSAYDNLWLATSNGVLLAFSIDGGTTWAGASNALAGGTDIAVNGLLWVMTLAAGAAGGISYSTNKGVSWAAVAVGNHRLGAGWKRILLADGRFMIAKGDGAAIQFAFSLR